jgi:cytochrome P450
MPARLYRWRRVRRASHDALTKAAVQRYHPIQTKEANILVTSLLTNPEDRKQHFMRAGASTIMAILYDYPTLASAHNKAIEDIERNLLCSKQATALGSFLVESFPWMLHIPQRYRLSPLFLGCIRP